MHSSALIEARGAGGILRVDAEPDHALAATVELHEAMTEKRKTEAPATPPLCARRWRRPSPFRSGRRSRSRRSRRRLCPRTRGSDRRLEPRVCAGTSRRTIPARDPIHLRTLLRGPCETLLPRSGRRRTTVILPAMFGAGGAVSKVDRHPIEAPRDPIATGAKKCVRTMVIECSNRSQSAGSTCRGVTCSHGNASFGSPDRPPEAANDLAPQRALLVRGGSPS
jgi:hypothetical protein